jgi:blue copper oxidase
MKIMIRSSLIAGFGLICSAYQAQTLLPVPDTLTGPSFVLNMHKDSVQFFPGGISKTFAFNQYRYLGPTLIFNKGANVSIIVNNQIGDTTTVHWHGIHLPARWDGGPHTPILPGGSWNPQFTVMDQAATYWYHPHMHMKTAEQAIKGAAGLIIVRDPIEAALTLPRKYGVDDIPLIIQCQQYNTQNQAMPQGMQDSTLLVNGARAGYGYTVYANLPAQVVRLRLLNASGERAFNFGFTGNKPFSVIAGDGGLLNAPVNLTRIRLAPGERVEILLNLAGMNGQAIHLKSYASELPVGIQGGPTMPMPPGSPPMDSPLNGADFDILQINVVPQTSSPVTAIPATLTSNVSYPLASANATRTIRFTADSLMVMDGPFYFNDSSFNMMRIDYLIPLNNIEVWKLVNETMVAHPFHIHDVQFYILDRNGNPPAPEESGRKDVVLVPPGDSLLFITKFEDFTDTIPYMYHCHILMHEDDGMMGQFAVTNSQTGIYQNAKSKARLLVYPNPAAHVLTIASKGLSLEGSSLNIYNSLGIKIYTVDKVSAGMLQISTAPFAAGLYTLEVKNNSTTITQKFVKE